MGRETDSFRADADAGTPSAASRTILALMARRLSDLPELTILMSSWRCASVNVTMILSIICSTFKCN
jgi:hypothetical protein